MKSVSHQLNIGAWAVDPRDCWATPQVIFNEINKELHATVDACALADSAKVARFWSPDNDGLLQDWSSENVWCNPPYSFVTPWICKAIAARVSCVLVPTRTDLEWWHVSMDHVIGVDFFRGRIAFIPPDGVIASSSAERHCLLWFKSDANQKNQSIRIRSRCSKTGRLL